ncbi:MAG TPA: WD40 repeat domain-containing serine/threonine protein kinase, partial [Verrucomicrobiota bacterium]|nr:WD40 repeat domain-containing serine/threonine protein kinase [Verrucomicrobiota bacterium]
MDHPNIARVLDADSTDAGHPYFVMDLVRGSWLTHFCDDNRLETRRRLELVIQVCRAVEHAHQKGIIHRDLKPSNILVALEDGQPVPKVIDFGIAKAMQRAAGPGALTDHSERSVGTPQYMSPEQLLGLDVDTRSDLYSLGVIIFELLTATVPNRSDRTSPWRPGHDEERRPLNRLFASPRDVLGSCAARQQTDARGLTKIVRGDLDLIVSRALALERDRRYASVGELARDLRQFLNHEPISARPDSSWYRARKFVRRHRVAVASSGAIAAGLVLGGALFGWQYLEKTVALDRAELAEREGRIQRERLQRATIEERKLRQDATVQAVAARRQAYAADMNLAQQALNASNLGRARTLLERYLPRPGEPDLRNWEWRYLWSHCQNDALFVLGRLNAEVTALSISFDGKWLLAEDRTGGLTLWDLSRRTLVGEFAPTSGAFRHAASFSPVAPLWARSHTTSLPGNEFRHGVEIQSIELGREIQFLPTDTPVIALWFSADGNELISAEMGNQLVRWDVASGARRQERSLGGDARVFGPIELARDLSMLAQDIGGGRFRVVDTADGRERFLGQAPWSSIRGFSFSPDGQHLAITGGLTDTDVAIWSTADAREAGRLRGHSAWIGGLSFFPDGKTLATTSADQTIRLWDVESMSAKGVLRGHQLEVWSAAVSSDGKRLVSGSKDGIIQVWDPSRPSESMAARAISADAVAWKFSADSSALFTLSKDGAFRIRSLTNLESTVKVMPLNPRPVGGAISPDGSWIATVTADRELALWNVSGSQGIEVFSALPRPATPITFAGTSNHLITWHPKEQRFRLSDIVTEEVIAEWSGDLRRSPGQDSSWAANETLFLQLGSEGGRMRDLGSGEMHNLNIGEAGTSGLALSPDGSLAAVANRSGVTRLWRTSPAAPAGELRGLLLGAHGVAFSPDGSRIAVASVGREAIKMFTVADGEELLTLEVPGESMRSPAFSPDSTWLGASGSGGRLFLWHAAVPKSDAHSEIPLP